MSSGQVGFKFSLGSRLRDRLLGVEGVATSRHEYINGCRRYGLERLKGEGDMAEDWFDEQPPGARR